jgi:hypothetical protein
LVLAIVAYLLAHWMDQGFSPPPLDWAEASRLALSTLFPTVVWHQLLKLIPHHADLAAQFGFEITLKRLPHWPYQDCCKI